MQFGKNIRRTAMGILRRIGKEEFCKKFVCYEP
jgi:hypothetical protein